MGVKEFLEKKKIKYTPFDKNYLKSILFFVLIIFLLIVLIFLEIWKLFPPQTLLCAILVSYFVFFIFIILQKNSKESINQISLFVLFILLITTAFTIYISIPNEKRGKNTEQLNVNFNFYIVDNEISKEELEGYISKASKIWDNYNISIEIQNIYTSKINLSDKERNILYAAISEKNTSEENKIICEKEYMPLINKITDNSPNKSIIFVKGEINAGGRASLCGHSFALFQYDKICLKDNKFCIRDLTGWNLAHEIGHIFGLSDMRDSYKLNLMNDRHKLFYTSDFLNQQQIDKVIQTVKTKFEQEED
jgi:energy-coupling factor transporter transmembrane protein EcfT